MSATAVTSVHILRMTLSPNPDSLRLQATQSDLAFKARKAFTQRD
jgi:hypothetical protein